MTYQRDNPLSRDVYESVKRRWDGRTECIKIESVTNNGTLVLKEGDGFGNDWEVWKHYINGTYKWKWDENKFGLRISM